MVSQPVCRLCSSNQNLLWVFDQKCTEDMSEIIKVTCGVEILKNDDVTQMVCNTCYQLTKKMYQFRNKSIKNDKDLKARHAASHLKQSTENNKQQLSDSISTKNSTSSSTDKYKFAHPSVKEIVVKYPNIILPLHCLKSHVGAYITLLPDEVNEYFQEKGMTDEEIEATKKESFEYYCVKKQPAKKGKKRKDTRSSSSRVSGNKKIRKSSDSSNTSKTTSVISDDSVSIKNKMSSEVDVKNSSSVNSVKVLSDIRIRIKENLDKTHLNNLIKELSREKVKGNSFEKPKEKTHVSNENIQEKVMEKLKEIPKVKPVSPLREILKNNDSTSLNAEKDKDMPRNISSADKIRKISTTSPSGSSLIIDVDDDIQLLPGSSILKTALKKTDISSQENSSKNKTESKLEGLGQSLANLLDVGSRTTVNLPTNNKEASNMDVDTSSGTNTEIYSECSSNMDSDSRNSSKSGTNHESNKNSFIRALQLTPRVAEDSNMPDLSLVSVTTKSYTLYTCKVCDSQHNSLKDLKAHSRKTHTKCPFCSKRFRTLMSRDEHVATTCAVSKSMTLIKDARLILKKVEDDEEIRKNYPNLFQDDEDTVSSDEIIEISSSVQEAPVVCDSATSDAITELEKFLTCTEVVSEKDSERAVEQNLQIENQTNNSTEVICISDEESESQTTVKEKDTTTVPKINIVNSEFLNGMNLHDSDVNILKKILTHSPSKPVKQDIHDLLKCPIEDSNNSRVKIFKNLRNFLHHYKIPIELYHSQTISAEIKPRKAANHKSKVGLWNHLNPAVLTPFTKQSVLKTLKPATSTSSPLILNGHIDLTQKFTNTSPIPGSSTNINVQPVVGKTLTQKSTVSSVQNKTLPTTMSFIAFTTPTPSNAYPHQRPTLYLLPNSLLPQSSVQTSQASIPVIQSIGTTTLKTPAQDQPSPTTVQQLESITNSLMPPSQTINNTVKVSSVVTSSKNSIPSVSAAQAVKQGIRVKNIKELS